MFELTLTNFLTWVIILGTAWMLRERWIGRLDSNKPLIYYLGLVLYVRGLEGEFENYIIFAAIVSALFLRFEFLGGWFLRLFRLIEFVCLFYVMIRAFGVLGRA